jgi:hypothetical protein
MANQAETGTMGGAASGSATSGVAGTMQEAAAMHSASTGQGEMAVPSRPVGPYPSYHGRRVSWIAVSIMMVGFTVGGLALVFGPTWWVFWLGCGIAVVGLLTAIATNMFEDWY